LAEALKHHDDTMVKSVRHNAKTDMHVMQKQTGTFRKNWSKDKTFRERTGQRSSELCI